MCIYAECAAKIDSIVSFSDKRVLEIGCGSGELLKEILKYNPKHIIGIDLVLSEWWGIGESQGENWCVKDGNAEALSFYDNSFDIIISTATFEHINNVEAALSEIKRVLKPYGVFYTSFMPIWTSVVGHHFGANSATTWDVELVKLIPPWGHLYMDEAEMTEHLLKINAGDKVNIDNAVDFIYRSKIINRLSRTEVYTHI